MVLYFMIDTETSGLHFTSKMHKVGLVQIQLILGWRRGSRKERRGKRRRGV